MEKLEPSPKEILKLLDRIVIGYRQEKKILLAALLSRGHVLLEGVPGIAKTTLVRALARILGLLGVEQELDGVRYKGYSRIQFTPDLMPGDITGSLIFNPKTREFEPRLGPIFAYIVLADEINRATPRTQSALLEAMQEKQVTIGENTYPLENPDKGKFFFVAATQNPVEQEGTYLLPEAQLDRFTVRIIMDYPESLEDEKNILRLHKGRLKEPIEDVEPIATPKWVVEAQKQAAKVEILEELLEYITLLIRLTRPEVNPAIAQLLEMGASPRAGIAIMRLAQSLALIEEASTVTKTHVDQALFPALNHRLAPRLEKILETDAPQHRARYRVLAEAIAEVKKNAQKII